MNTSNNAELVSIPLIQRTWMLIWQTRDPASSLEHPMDPPWQSLTALVRDINFLQSQNVTLNEQLWQHGGTVQQLSLQIHQLSASLTQAEGALHRVQEELGHHQLEVANEKEQRAIAKKSLDHEFLKHEETEKNLAHARDTNRCFVTLVNKLNFSGSGQDRGTYLPEDFKIGSLLKENHDLKHDLTAKKAQLENNKRVLERKEQTIIDLENKNDATLQVLGLKDNEILSLKAELYEFDSEGETEVNTAVFGKRKRADDESD